MPEEELRDTGGTRKMLDRQRLGTFLIGGLAGAVAGLLLAPKSGREIRTSVANRVGEARERGRETFFEAQERMQERLAETRGGAYGRRFFEEEVTLGPASEAPTPREAPFDEGSFDQPPERTSLRDVSRDVPAEEPPSASGEAGERSEELRRKIRETRARLGRARSEAPDDAGEE